MQNSLEKNLCIEKRFKLSLREWQAKMRSLKDSSPSWKEWKKLRGKGQKGWKNEWMNKHGQYIYKNEN